MPVMPDMAPATGGVRGCESKVVGLEVGVLSHVFLCLGGPASVSGLCGGEKLLFP